MNLKWFSIAAILIFCLSAADPTFALRCYQCDSAVDSSCKYHQAETEESAMTIQCSSGITECFSYLSNDGQVSRRGCLDPPTGTSCTGEACQRCSSELCNSQQLAYDTCAVCDSSTDDHCEATSSDLTTTISCGQATASKSGCYRYSDTWMGGHTKRGCVTTLEGDVLADCTENGEKCKRCAGDLCNLKDNFQRCLICDSESNPECLDSSPPAKFLSICKDYLDSCAAFVIPNGKTVRGCLKEIDPDPTYCPSTNCVVCYDSDCNQGVVPSHRILCYQCDSNTDPLCESSQKEDEQRKAKPCATFKFDDQCYMSWNEGNEIGFRGCTSDQSQAVTECEKDPIRCSKCSDSNCNFDYLTRESTLRCVHCDKNPACMWSFRSSNYVCQKRVPFYKTESCYNYLYPSGVMAKRGCTLDDADFCQGNTCSRCTDYFCNGASYLKQSCVRCRSDGNDSKSQLCEAEANNIPGEECIVDPIYTERGCYSFRDAADVVHRGCYFDMEEDWRVNCETNHEKRCTRCYGLNCNTNVQGGGGIKTVSSTLMGIVVGVAVVGRRVSGM